MENDSKDFNELIKDDKSKINTVNDMKFLTFMLKTYPEYEEYLDNDKLLRLSRYLDYYNNISSKNEDEELLLSYTNFQNETIVRMQMMGVISFLFQGVEEYGLKSTDMYIKKDVTPEVLAKREVVKDFLMDMFEYNPLKHVRDCYSDFKDKMTDEKKSELKSSIPEVLHPTLDHLASADIFANYDRFFSMYFNELYGLTNKLFGFSEKLSFGINPYVVGNVKDIEKFEEENEQDLKIRTHSIKMCNWTFLGPWRQNSNNVKYRIAGGDETIDVNKALRQTDYGKLRNEMVRLKTENMKKESDLTDEDKQALKRYGENLGISDVIEEAINAQNTEVPDDALEYGVIVHDAQTGKTTEGKLHFKNRVEESK